MSRIHLVQCMAGPRAHGLNGYREVVETVAWGLTELGHAVTSAVNRLSTDTRNIVFGAQVLPMNLLEQLPRDTIVYNFEQMRGVPTAEIRPEIRYCAEAFEIWEYSTANLDSWAAMGCSRVRVMPVGYAPSLTRIPRPHLQDIDILFYGLTSGERLSQFHAISRRGLSSMFACGLYGEGRDTLIARAKIVLNLNLYSVSKIFEIVRVSYLLANRKAVLSELHDDTFLDDEILTVVKFAALDAVPDACEQLVRDDAMRARIEDAGFEYMLERDVRTILAGAL